MPDVTSPVLVTGMHRSGTSLTAQLLSQCGVWFGNREDLFASDDSNQDGYFEHRRLSWVARRFELSLCLPSLGVDPLPPAWRDFPYTGNLMQSLQQVLEKSFKGREAWGWKDPDIAWFLPFVVEALGPLGVKPTIVICIRNPEEVALSQLKRSGTPKERTYLSWLRHMLSALDDSRGMERVLIPFELLFSDPSFLRHLLPSLDGGGMQAWAEVVKPGRRHHGGEGIPGSFHFSELMAGTMEVASKPEDFAKGILDRQIKEMRECFDSLTGLLECPLPPAVIGAWTKKSSSFTNHYPQRKWEKVSVPINLDGGEEATLQLYGMPSNVWVRSAVWKGSASDVPAQLKNGRHAGIQRVGDLICFQLSAGQEQIVVQAPDQAVHALEIDAFYEVSSLISATHSKHLLSSLGL